MSCKTCDHTMQSIAKSVWWCPRCGSISSETINDHPSIVDRVRTLYVNVENEDVEDKMYSIGLIESVLLPEYRGKRNAKRFQSR